MHKHKNGFTLMEMLIVVAIIAVLVAVAIPTFVLAKEKASRAVDMANARSIQALLATMVMTGDITFPEKIGENDTVGVWVLLTKDTKSYPRDYPANTKGSTLFCGCDPGMTVNGETTRDWSRENTQLRQAVVNALGGATAVKTHSNGKSTVNDIGGWDWVIIEYTLDAKTDSHVTRIYSGMAGERSSFTYNIGNTNIERYMK